MLQEQASCVLCTGESVGAESKSKLVRVHAFLCRLTPVASRLQPRALRDQHGLDQIEDRDDEGKRTAQKHHTIEARCVGRNGKFLTENGRCVLWSKKLEDQDKRRTSLSSTSNSCRGFESFRRDSDDFLTLEHRNDNANLSRTVVLLNLLTCLLSVTIYMSPLFLLKS